MNIVELNQISKTYDTKVAVDALSLQIEAGKMFGLLGPNGAGKTSTIRMMIGITMPDSGSVYAVRPALLPQESDSRRLPAGRTRPVQEDEGDRSAGFPGPVAWPGCDRRPIRAPASGANVCRSWTRSILKTEELSKGMQQKIQFISTLLHEPALIIMDEPFSGLDPVNTQLLQETLLELKNAGKAILFSTHRMDQVEKLCDSICLVDGGKAVLSGGMRELKSRYPRNHVVIDFEGGNSFVNHPAVQEYKAFAGPCRDSNCATAPTHRTCCGLPPRARRFTSLS